MFVPNCLNTLNLLVDFEGEEKTGEKFCSHVYRFILEK